MSTFYGKAIFWRRMAPVLKKYDYADKLAAFKEKVKNLPNKNKARKKDVLNLKLNKKSWR